MDHFKYGAVGNCRSAALISDKGSIDWFCFPDFDSPSIFAKLLDDVKGGCFAFIVDDHYSVSQKYVEHTNILSTTYNSIEGGFEVLDFEESEEEAFVTFKVKLSDGISTEKSRFLKVSGKWLYESGEFF